MVGGMGAHTALCRCNRKRGRNFIDGHATGPTRLDDKGLVTIEVTARWQGLQFAYGLHSGSRSASGKTVSADIGQNLNDTIKKAVDDNRALPPRIMHAWAGLGSPG
jgi:hypothetical protein